MKILEGMVAYSLSILSTDPELAILIIIPVSALTMHELNLLLRFLDKKIKEILKKES
jgi:hypothetical protein